MVTEALVNKEFKMNRERREKRKVLRLAKKAESVKRKIAKIQVQPQVLGEMFKHLSEIITRDGKEYVVQHGVPADAKCVGVYVNPLDNTLQIYFESETFEAIADGERMPSLDVTVSELKEEDAGDNQTETIQAE